jgi:hypothetical protein
MGMVVGLCEITMHLRQVRSLKGKRRVVRQVIDRCRSRFEVSIAETGSNDSLREALIGFSFVSNDSRNVVSTVDRVLSFIQDLHLAEVVQAEREVIHWEGPWGNGVLTLADLPGTNEEYEADDTI